MKNSVDIGFAEELLVQVLLQHSLGIRSQLLSIFSDLGRHLENVPKIQLEEQFHSYELLVLPFDQPHEVIAIKEMIHLALDKTTIPII